ncbi:MAG: TonB-dependent receptor [Bacteroidota bacterium]
MKRWLIGVVFLSLSAAVWAQEDTGLVRGVVSDANGTLAGVTVQVVGTGQGVVTNAEGRYNLPLKAGIRYSLRFRYVGYRTQSLPISVEEGITYTLNVTMQEDTRVLRAVEIEGTQENDRETAGLYRLDPASAQSVPTPFQEFNRILVTLPGVVAPSELSSAYSVRGGSYDENLVYVNDMPVYRPFLIRAGQQEGLSFINSDLVGGIEFSAGGWEPRYGDKLSSVLNITYRRPTEFRAAASGGLLGATAQVEGKIGPRVSYLAGIRHKRAQYLLNTLPTEGQYRPRFTDVQNLLRWDLSKNPGSDNPTTELEWLSSYAQNQYLVFPESRETTFGTFSESFRLFVGFIGQESLTYTTFQNGLKLTHRWSDRFTSKLILNGLLTSEREFFDVEGGYRLCDVDNDPGSSTFNECLATVGIGSLYRYGRNVLQAQLYHAETRNELVLDNSKLEAGVSYSWQQIDDSLDEYTFSDSSDYVINLESLDSEVNLDVHRVEGYLQHRWSPGTQHQLVYGVRLNYFSLNNQLLISPRAQYAYRFPWERDMVLRLAVGAYNQPPFYREMRDFDGSLNTDLRAQRSWHFIGGLDYAFQMWERPFKLVVEGYYKSLNDLVAYEIDNVRLRYYANNDAVGFAQGIDVRLNGEFIEGSESWFSLGVLQTQEDLGFDDREFIRRPTDQRVTTSIFFRDHVPWDERFQVNLNAQFATGLPFGPPRDLDNRNAFTAAWYRRVDVGFSYILDLEADNRKLFGVVRSVWLGADVLNLLGASNDISFLWIPDFSGRQFAVPNSLTQRFFNFRAIVRI